MRFPFPGWSRWEMLWWFSLILAVVLLCSSCGSQRAQAGADARAGISAAKAAFAAGEATADVVAILEGVDRYLPAATGVNSADWPAPTMTPEQIRVHPARYGSSAPPEPTRWDLVAIASGMGLAALWIAKNLAPMVPGGGPLVASIADTAWKFFSSKKQKEADVIKDQVQSAAIAAQPILEALRSLPLDMLPPRVRDAIDSPLALAALYRLTKPQVKENQNGSV